MEEEIGLVWNNGVFVGQPKLLGQWKGREIISAIDKTLCTKDTVTVDNMGIVGDGQADLKVHGGIDKAVYGYPSEHYKLWNQELGTDFSAGDFGENLTFVGIDENTVRVGDIWSLGQVYLQVTKPRQPCYKLIMKAGVEDIIQRMRANGRTGWYFKVIQPGSMPTNGGFVTYSKDDGRLTMAQAYALKTQGPINPGFFG